ncbi:MAG: glyceraldehyde 3-phosphate dehydrogenase, glyceraldehyde 3-phosphate dehydrogenase [Candidatus Parcubacteria bacterium]|jgi:glyceraldehyde 3-phosphate dehydrogenase
MDKKIRVGINGFGRIGRAFFKLAYDRDDIEVVAINDLGDIHNLAYLLQYDTVYRVSHFDVNAEVHPAENEGQQGEQYLVAEGEHEVRVRVFQEKDPSLIPWGTLDVDVVVESTGLFVAYDKASAHLRGGAKHVVISAPAKKGEDESVHGETILMAVNEDKFGTCQVTSNASCTTNASSPVIAILDEAIGIDKAILNTVHSYTASQGIVDGPNKKDFREGRAAAQNIVPSSTGAAIAVTKAFPKLEGLFDGVSIRVPTPAGSIADITFIAKRDVTADEVNQILRDAAQSEKWSKIFTATDEELVSSDIIGLPYASIVDLKMTRVVGGNLVKILAWYDNEMGYTNTLVEHVVKAGKAIAVTQ